MTNYKMLFIAAFAILISACTSQPVSSDREPQAMLSQELEEIRVMSDTPMRKHVRDFLSTAAGDYSFRGSKGCDSIVIKAYDNGTERVVEVQVGKDKTWVGGTKLYPVQENAHEACSSLALNQLQCKSTSDYTAGYGYTPVPVTTDFSITKDQYGKVILFKLEQNAVPKIKVICGI
ncbi:MAG: hypothetical protein EOP09_20555 [Proteobacteria bacterium]|nr:MAG: hypothetical protein EOP09_20555 [Pseudomonadota bacterium]